MNIYEINWLINDKTEYKSASIICSNYNVKTVHLKKVISKGKVVNYFWNSKNKEVIKGMGTLKTLKNIISLSYVHTDSDEFIQLGHSVMVYKKLSVDGESFIFGYITGVMRREGVTSYEITRISLDNKIDGSTIRILKDRSVPIFFLSDGVKDRYAKMAQSNNLLKIKYKYQIDAAEFVLGNSNTFDIIWNKYSKRDLPLGEVAFKDIHYAMFGKIYHWGGVYRKHEIVVGDRNRATIDASDINKAMKSCFRKVAKPNLAKIKTGNELALILTELHRELAWIHPFEDGNGRSIRMYLFILSLSLGYYLDLSKLNGTKKRKSLYHYAVRKSIYDSNRKYLYGMLCNCLSKLTNATNEI